MTNREFKQALADKAGVVPLIPVGRSYEVYASSSEQAVFNALNKAKAAKQATGRALHVCQIEAGKWEVVFVDPTEEAIPNGQ